MSDYLIYKRKAAAENCVYVCRLRMHGIHKNSIFCLSKLIKSNEWDFRRLERSIQFLFFLSPYYVS